MMDSASPLRTRALPCSERGAIHIFAAIIVAIVLLVAYTNIQDWVAEKRAARSSDGKAAAIRDVFLSPLDALTRLDGEQQQVTAALGLAKSKEDMLLRASKMTEEEKLAAQQRISQVIKQPASLPLDRLIELAFARWGAVIEYLDAQQQQKQSKK